MLIHMDLDGTTECDSENFDKYAMLFNRSPLMHSSAEAKEVSYASLNGYQPVVCRQNVETPSPSQKKHNNTDDEDKYFEDTFDRSMELSFCEAVKNDANLQYEEEKTYKCSISNTCSMLYTLFESILDHRKFIDEIPIFQDHDEAMEDGDFPLSQLRHFMTNEPDGQYIQNSSEEVWKEPSVKLMYSWCWFLHRQYCCLPMKVFLICVALNLYN
jgi:hypothetical protein